MKKIMLYKVLPLFAVALMGLAMATSCEEENNGSGNSGNNGGDETPVGWVDLGLPSGLLWAECNVGATAPEQYGDYFAWGETQPKSVYDWRNYIYCIVDEGTGDPDTLTKYNTLSSYGIPDSLTVLLPGDDAATVNMGNGARTPTREDWQELLDNTTSEWTTLNGVYGLQFSANGKTLFLPAAGYFKDSDIYFIDGNQSYGYYSSASLNGNNPIFICDFYFYSETHSLIDNYNSRSTGLSVRAVRAGRK
jgi:hypothetical protein